MASSAGSCLRKWLPMSSSPTPRVAILDYGVGNLFSVKHACAGVGLEAAITSDKDELLRSNGVFLPGMGAFGDAITALHRLDVVEPLRDIAAAGKPLVGICLGLQLLMSESEEFGRHRGLGIIQGQVVHFGEPRGAGGPLKVPQVGWNRIWPSGEDGGEKWGEGPLKGIAPGEYMYFVHSYVVVPEDKSVAISMTRYGDVEFCSAVRQEKVFACQFHPERSGVKGIEIYWNLARDIRANVESGSLDVA